MNCTKCNAVIEDGALYCEACGNQIAVNEQKAKVNAAYANNKGIIVKQLKSPIFLVVAILFSVIFAGQIVSMFSGGIFGILSGILPFIFMLIATIGLWKGYAAKDPAAASSALLKASIFDAYTRVMHTISIVLLYILGVLSFILAIFGAVAAGSAASSMGANDAGSSLLGGGIVTAIVILVVFGIIITIVTIFKNIYANRRAYFKILAHTAETGNYPEVKVPVIGSYILGGFDVLSGIFPVILAISGGALIDALFGDLLASLGGLGDVVNTILATMLVSLAISGVSSLVSGGYLVLSAVWMSLVHKAELANKDAVAIECARLEEIEAATKDAMFLAEKKRRDEEDAKRRAAEAERAAAEAEKAAAEEKARQAQIAMQEQQQQMMQMMMMQMMQANGMNMANMAAPVAEEPVAEAPVEEPVAEETVVEEVAAEEPVAEEVVAEEVAAEEVAAEEPAVEEVAEEPAAEEPVAETVE